MPQIARLIEQLDGDAGRKESVAFYELHNSDPQDVNPVLEDLFHRTGAISSSSSGANSLLGNNNPLSNRQLQNTSTIGNSTSGNGTTGRTGNTGNMTGTSGGF